MALIVTRDLALGRLHWPLPLPAHAELIGTVQRRPGSPYIWAGALLRFTTTGQYVEGRCPGIRTLSQHEVERALGATP